MRYRGLRDFVGRFAVATGLIAGFLVLAGTPRVQAGDDCQERISRADHRLHEAVEHHGYQSKQAERARHELQEARERCWNANKRWWDEDQHRWHSERDWDDHDHDHDHDRDDHH